MKEQGPRLGYEEYADAITTDRDGDYVIRDKPLRKEILALREDPQIAADMAAAFTQANGEYLAGKFGKHPSPGELYIAHFLGPQGAERLFRAGLDNPDQIAAKLFPKQAKANPSIFYSDGDARTIRELYRALVAKHGGPVETVPVEDPKFATQQLAQSAETRWPVEPVPSRLTKDDMSFTSFFSTQANRPVEPLIATDALQSLVAPEISEPLMSYAATAEVASVTAPAPVATPAPVVDSELGFVPLPTPAPLTVPMEQVAVAAEEKFAEGYTMPVAAGVAGYMDTGVPRPRVLMGDKANVLFLTQLYGQN
jgi:hypothetical protein